MQEPEMRSEDLRRMYASGSDSEGARNYAAVRDRGAGRLCPQRIAGRAASETARNQEWQRYRVAPRSSTRPQRKPTASASAERGGWGKG